MIFLNLFLLLSPLDSSKEPYLKNICQLTFSSMGLKKAGEAYFSPEETSIIFQGSPLNESDYQMYVMDLEKKEPFLVSEGVGTCTCGYFSPVTQKILFSSNHESPLLSSEKKEKPAGKYKWDLTPYMNIYESNLDGSHKKRLTSGPFYHAEASYSPDGKEILYASNEDGSMNLYLLNKETLESTQITHTSDCYNGGPFFSPDGSKVIFRSDREKPDYLQIYLIDKDGSNERQLTKNQAVNWAPYFHPNGKVIAFTTSLHGHHQYEIYLLNIETGKTCRLTHNPSFDGLPVFNKKGDKIMWTSKRSKDGSCQIFIADFTMPKELQ